LVRKSEQRGANWRHHWENEREPDSAALWARLRRDLVGNKRSVGSCSYSSRLDPGDILFIDSSHGVKIEGDVNYPFLQVVPRLKPGVIVHIHDVFLPFDYRRDWMIMEQFRFWSEQYLLQTFLTLNPEFEVLMANNYLNYCHQEDLKATFQLCHPCVEVASGCAAGSV
jgi:hypothetical protein